MFTQAIRPSGKENHHHQSSPEYIQHIKTNHIKFTPHYKNISTHFFLHASGEHLNRPEREI